MARGKRKGSGKKQSDKGLPGTILVKLLPSPEQSAQLRRTLHAVNAACDWLAERAFDQRCADPDVLRERYYRELKARFDLQAQYALQVIAKVCGAYVRDLTRQPHFRPDGGFSLIYKDLWTCPATMPGIVSIATLDGRIKVPYAVGAMHAELFHAAATGRTEADLIYRRGTWFLSPVVRHPTPEAIVSTDTLGVDFGIVNLAVDSDGKVYSGDRVERRREYYAGRRQKLQTEKSDRSHAKRRKDPTVRPITRSLRKKLAATRGHDRNFRSNENHRISKRIVQTAQGTGRRISVEDLTGIRQGTTVRRDQRARHYGWGFAQLRAFVTYKAVRAGVPVVVVPPRGTSTTCLVPACRHCEPANRLSRDVFKCKVCGFTAPADYVGARNIELKANVCWPLVPRDHREKTTQPRVSAARSKTPRSVGTSRSCKA